MIYATIEGAIVSNQSRGWPVTDGTIQESSVEICPRTSRDTGTTYTREPRIRYTYFVDDREWKGSQVDPEVYRSTNVDEVMARYPVGKAVNVYYNPVDPSMACLEPGLKIGPLQLGLMCIFLTFMFLAFFPMGVFFAYCVVRRLSSRSLRRGQSSRA